MNLQAFTPKHEGVLLQTSARFYFSPSRFEGRNKAKETHLNILQRW